MKILEPINWNALPDEMNKEQFRIICHISNATAAKLLESGVVPCVHSGKKTRCYTIRKTDVQAYLKNRRFHEKIKYGCDIIDFILLEENPPEEIIRLLNQFYSDKLLTFHDIISISEIANLTGYSRRRINNWCHSNQIKHFTKNRIHYVPKVFLIEFFCSSYFLAIRQKSTWHIQTLSEFQTMVNDVYKNEEGTK